MNLPHSSGKRFGDLLAFSIGGFSAFRITFVVHETCAVPAPYPSRVNTVFFHQVQSAFENVGRPDQPSMIVTSTLLSARCFTRQRHCTYGRCLAAKNPRDVQKRRYNPAAPAIRCVSNRRA